MTNRIPLLDIYHSNRFRRIDNVFPSVVAAAYGGNIGKAARDTDSQVFAKVRAFEIEQGREPQDWQWIGIENALIDAGYDMPTTEDHTP